MILGWDGNESANNVWIHEVDEPKENVIRVIYLGNRKIYFHNEIDDGVLFLEEELRRSE